MHARPWPVHDDARRARRARREPSRSERLVLPLRSGAARISWADRTNNADVLGGASSGATALRTRTRKARTSSASRAPITIYGLTLLGVEHPNPSTGSGHVVARLRIACSEGTYIRTLCHDLGEAQSASRRTWERSCAKLRVRLCSTNRRHLDEIATEPERALFGTRAHHSVSYHRSRFARVGRLSRRARRSAAGRSDRKTRLRARRVAHARRRRRSARRTARSAQSLRLSGSPSRAHARRRSAVSARDRLLRWLSSRPPRDCSPNPAPAKARLAIGLLDVRKPSGRASCGREPNRR